MICNGDVGVLVDFGVFLLLSSEYFVLNLGIFGMHVILYWNLNVIGALKVSLLILLSSFMGHSV